MTTEHQATPIAAAELAQLRKDAERYRWIIENVVYLEHKVGGKLPGEIAAGGYWPETAGEYCASTNPDLLDVGLNDYLKAVIDADRMAAGFGVALALTEKAVKS